MLHTVRHVSMIFYQPHFRIFLINAFGFAPLAAYQTLTNSTQSSSLLSLCKVTYAISIPGLMANPGSFNARLCRWRAPRISWVAFQKVKPALALCLPGFLAISLTNSPKLLLPGGHLVQMGMAGVWFCRWRNAFPGWRFYFPFGEQVIF